MKVAVIGSTGQLAQDLLRVFGDEATGLSHQQLEVTDGVGVAETLYALRPDWVVNTAAFHRVDDCERNPEMSFSVNAVGARNVARVAQTLSAGVVFFSTDYVFGADVRKRGHPYVETDRPGPLNVYGVSKWAGEQLVMQANPRHLIVRSTGLYGTATSRKGWTFPELMLNKAKTEGVLRVVTDQVLTPTNTADLAAAVKKLIERDATGLFHVTNGGECSWFEFAQKTLELAGQQAALHPIETSQLPGGPCRPAYSALASNRLAATGVDPLPAWQDALATYLTAKGFI
jgi:dTDP-4-dehydrorhamnose reductase